MYYQDLEHFKGVCGYTIDGVWYPRVTKIIDIKSKPALYRFYAELENFGKGEEIKRISANEGTRIHEAVEKILVGETPEPDPSIAPSIEAFLLFLKGTPVHVDPAHVERKVFHPKDRYAGTIDALATIGGTFGLCDIKTSQAVYRDYDLQTGAYMAALEREFPHLETRWILRIDQYRTCAKCGATLRQKGGRDKIRLPRGTSILPPCEHEWSAVKGYIELDERETRFPWRDDFQAFLGAKKLWEWDNMDWLKRVGYF